MDKKQQLYLGIGLGALALAGLGAWGFTRYREQQAGRRTTVTVQTGVADVDVKYKEVKLDLSHLEQGGGFRYHGTVVV